MTGQQTKSAPGLIYKVWRVLRFILLNAAIFLLGSGLFTGIFFLMSDSGSSHYLAAGLTLQAACQLAGLVGYHMLHGKPPEPEAAPEPEAPAVPAHGEIDTSRPIIQRIDYYARSEMDGVRLNIRYQGATGEITRRIIRCTELFYEQNRLEIIPNRIDAFCELRQGERTFMTENILEVRQADGQPIPDLAAYLAPHTAIPRGDEPYYTVPFSEDVPLDGSPVTIFYAQPNRPKDGEVTLDLHSMRVKTTNETGRQLHSISGHRRETGAHRTIRAIRITNACNPETGEVIADLLPWLDEHKAPDHSTTS